MNKLELSKIKRNLKKESYSLNIHKIFNAFGKYDSKKIVVSQVKDFNNFLEDEMDMLYSHFKKALTGTIGKKLFDLEFTNDEMGKEKQSLLLAANRDNFEENALKIADSIIKTHATNSDLVITIAKMSLYIVEKIKDEDDEVLELKFILCTVNKVEAFEKQFVVSVGEILQEDDECFRVLDNLDMIINLKKPLDSFMFPSITDGQVDVNKVFYVAPKNDAINTAFVEDVLSCSKVKTAKEEKEIFTSVLKETLGENIDTEIIHEVYTNLKEIAFKKEREDAGTFTSNDIKVALKNIGCDDNEVERVQSVIEETTGEQETTFVATNIIPVSSNKVNIQGATAKVSLNGDKLNCVKKKVVDGKPSLVIELQPGDKLMLDGIELS
ncbi:hypothetical protein BFS06_14575 [Clostridium perfringens]|nr:DUF4317 family protein [Clostridium perfringens]TBX14430.1 hypothetical protein BFS06_14575 [Clostridium perfringens]